MFGLAGCAIFAATESWPGLRALSAASRRQRSRPATVRKSYICMANLTGNGTQACYSGDNAPMSEEQSTEPSAAEALPPVQTPAEPVRNEPQPQDPRRRLRELLAIPDHQRTDAIWDEIIELEISLAPGNRIQPGSNGQGDAGRRPQPGARPESGATPGPTPAPRRHARQQTLQAVFQKAQATAWHPAQNLSAARFRQNLSGTSCEISTLIARVLIFLSRRMNREPHRCLG
jgi:hypothetical protein